jgi:hypothetical protein
MIRIRIWHKTKSIEFSQFTITQNSEILVTWMILPRAKLIDLFFQHCRNEVLMCLSLPHLMWKWEVLVDIHYRCNFFLHCPIIVQLERTHYFAKSCFHIYPAIAWLCAISAVFIILRAMLTKVISDHLLY